MADNANVIDELIVRLRLDAEQYKKTEHTINILVQNTEKKQKERDEKTKRRDRDQNNRWKELLSTGKRLALVGGAIATAIAGSLTGLTSFELGLRRQAVSTGLSNRQMQAWGSTARRLGADADAGAQAIANLAKEQKQFRLTGNAPTLQALARAGVRVSPDMSLPDILANAQNVYRRAAPAQQQQLEASLAAQGVSPDLILMIKSETDARAAYTKSLAEASTENRRALDAVSDSLAALKASSVSLANTLATVLQPGVASLAKWLSGAAQDASAFADKVIAAGGGIDGFMKVVDQESPALGAALHTVTGLFDTLGQVVDVVAYGLKELGDLIDEIPGMGKSKSASWAARASNLPIIGSALSLRYAAANSSWWQRIVGNARANGPAPAANLAASLQGNGSAGVPRGTGVSAQDLMTNLITRHGLSVPEAAAVAANWQRESGLNPGASNAAGGGQGALGAAQWRGSRIDAFRARYGTTPDRATLDQQIDFMLNDPYERSKLDQSFSRGGSAQQLGEAYSRIYEAHGKLGEDRTRGALAAQLATQYRAANPNAPAGPTINIQSMNVQANSAQEFGGSMTRLADTQNYNAAVR